MMIKYIQSIIKFFAIFYFFGLFMLIVLKVFSIFPQKEFEDVIHRYAYNGISILIFSTLFFTLDKRNGPRRNLTWLILTPMFSFLLYILMNLMSMFFYQSWVDFSIVYEHKSDSTTTIREQMEDQGSFGYGKRRIVQVDPMLFIFQRVTPVDTNQLEMKDWRYVNREGDVKWP